MKTCFACYVSLIGVAVATMLAGGCLNETREVALYPATEQIVDVFTCKGLDDQGHWIHVTDQFKPEEDPRVVVAAQLRPEHRQSWITYELTSPADFVVLSETIRYPKETDLGVHFDIERLMQTGGEGEWMAVVYADANPIGKAMFTLGEKEEEGEGVSRYYVVDSEPAPAEMDTSLQPAPAGETSGATEPVSPTTESQP